MHPIAPYYGAPPMAMGYRPPPVSAIPGIIRPPIGGIGGSPFGGLSGGPQPPPPAPLLPGNDFPPPTAASMQQMYPFKPPTFDSYLCESFFPRCDTEAEDTALTQV